MAVRDRKEKVIPLDRRAWDALEHASGFAVSLEPPQRPMDKSAPEGPVMYWGELIAL